MAFAEFDRPEAVWTVTGSVFGPTVSLSKPGARTWISVPVTLTMEKKSSCEDSCVGLPKLTQASVAELKPLPVIVTTEPPFSLASEAGPSLVEIDVIVGAGS